MELECFSLRPTRCQFHPGDPAAIFGHRQQGRGVEALIDRIGSGAQQSSARAIPKPEAAVHPLGREEASIP